MGIELQFLDALQVLHTQWLDRFMVFITALGNGGVLWMLIAALLLIIPRTRKLGAALAASLLLEAVCCNLLLKPLVGRARSFEVNTAVQLLVSRPTDFSFPSGHTGAAFASASALCFGGSRLWIPAGALALLIAFSRLYLYVHYPSDVAAGAVLGVMLGWLGSAVILRLWKPEPPIRRAR